MRRIWQESIWPRARLDLYCKHGFDSHQHRPAPRSAPPPPRGCHQERLLNAPVDPAQHRTGRRGVDAETPGGVSAWIRRSCPPGESHSLCGGALHYPTSLRVINSNTSLLGQAQTELGRACSVGLQAVLFHRGRASAFSGAGCSACVPALTCCPTNSASPAIERSRCFWPISASSSANGIVRSEEHTSELQSLRHLV